MINTIIQSILNSYSDFFILLSSLLGSFGLATILLSVLAALLMTMPLRWAGKIAAEEAKIQTIISPQIHTIHTNKIGSEQHLSINRLYSRYSYHPIFAVRSLMPLFIQLPYLIFTYFMFIGLQGVEGESFLWIKDLAKPDNTFPFIFGNGNMLPFVMLAVNMTATLFLVDFSRRNLIQAAGVSLLFFILLYNERSILLLFWTFNNCLMLLRSIVSYRRSDSDTKLNFNRLAAMLNKLVCSKEIHRLLIFIFICSIAFRYLFNVGIVGRFSLTFLVLGFACLMLGTALYLYRVIFNKNIESIKLPHTSYKKGDLFLTLLPITCIVQYALLNGDVLVGIEKIKFISFYTLLIVSPLCIVLPILNRFIPTFGFFPFLLSLTLIFVSFPILVAINSWYPGIPDLAYVISLLLMAFSLSLFLFYFKRKSFIALSILVFSVNTTFIFMQNENGLVDEAIRDVDYSNFIPKGEMVSKPDIYLLTYDSYVAQETMMQYGIDNSNQEKYLKNMGFVLYPDTYSITGSSRASMARVLEMSDSLQQLDVYSTAGNALVPDILSKEGYHTYGILTPYLLASPKVSYDTSFPEVLSSNAGIYAGVNQGEFKFGLIDKASSSTHEDFIKTKRTIFTSDTDYPKFMYTHTGPGHSQNSGMCRADETELFKQRLNDSNIEMQQDIESILSTKRDSIIIINGDHGPYLTGDCFRLNGGKVAKLTRLDLQDRFGTFLAIRWPELNSHELIDIRILQDTFEAVFGYLFQDKNILKKRVTTYLSPIAGSGGVPDTSIPESAISDGNINVGIDKGKPLFENK